MMAEKSRWENIYEILKALNEEGVDKTYMNWQDFERYMSFLIDCGFVRKSDGSERGYFLTDSGKRFFRNLDEVKAVLEFKDLKASVLFL
jgi:predicted transcriptional regulator